MCLLVECLGFEKLEGRDDFLSLFVRLNVCVLLEALGSERVKA